MNGSTSSARGRLPFQACPSEPRCSYCLYVPEQPARAVCAYVHGTERDAASYREALIPFAEACGCIILTPLFPAGIIEPDDVDNYKNIRFHDIRFDHLLLAMVDEVVQQYGLTERRFLLGGFSGGAQFAHRFYYLHPQRLLALSAAAPGRVTLPDEQLNWWLGVRDLPEQFGQPLQLDALRRVPVQLVIGADDTEDFMLDQTSPYWMPGVEHIGHTRIKRLRCLYASLTARGVDATLEIVPDTTHEAAPLIVRAAAFFANRLKEQPTHDASTASRL